MPSGGGKKRTASKPRSPKGARRPVLGNDPFERGAAVRETAAAAPAAVPTSIAAPPPTSTSTSTSTSPRSPIAAVDARLQEAATRAEDGIASVASRLRDLAAEEATGQHARDLVAVLRGAWPVIRERLGAVATLARLFDGSAALDPYGRDPALVARAAPALDALLDAWWRVDLRGAEGLPPGGAIVVANHGGRFHWDALVLLQLARRLGRELRPLLDEPALATPIAGRFAQRLGAVAATPGNALAILAEGGLAAVFPEGSRNGARPWAERYRIRRFGRGGFARIAIQAGVPIVPCAVVGSEETAAPFARDGWLAEVLGLPLLGAAPGLPLGPLGFLPLPSRWSIRFGEPIAPEAGASPDDAAAVNALTERTRDVLQRMLDEDVASRRSVYL